MPRKELEAEPQKKRKALTRESALGLGLAERRVVRAGDAPPEPNRAPVEGAPAYDVVVRDIEDHVTLGDQIDYLNASIGSTHEIFTTESGKRIEFRITKGGTVIGGEGEDIYEAYNHVLEQIQAFVRAGMVKTKEKSE